MRNSNLNMKRCNAVKHGGFTQQTILPGEDAADYVQLCSALMEEWKPVGPTELDAVITIAKCMWRKLRVQKFFAAKIEMCRADPEHLFFQEAVMLREHSNRIKTESPESVDRVDRPPCLSNRHAEHLREKFPKQNFASHSEWVQAVDEEIHSVLLPEADPPPDVMLLNESAVAFSENICKYEVPMDERLDAMIDRAIKRLVQTKAMKQMLGHTSAIGRHDQSNNGQSSKRDGSTKLAKHKATRARQERYQ